MADEFHLGSGNWWDASRNRFESGTAAAPSISTTLNAIASYGWPTEMVEMKPRSSMDDSGSGSMVLQGGADDQSGGGANVLANTNLQMMGLGLSSQGMDWNQSLFRGEKSEGSFRTMLQEDMSSNAPSNFQQESGGATSSQEHWRQKLYSGGGASSEDSSVNEFKQINRGFSLDQTQFSSQASSNDSSITSAGFQVDSATAYGLLLSENPHQHQSSGYETRSGNYPYPSSGYGANPGEMMPSWNKFPPFLRSSPPKPAAPAGGSHLHFTNNTPFWNASAPAAAMTDARPSFFPSLQTPVPAPPSFDEKPRFSQKNTTEIGTAAKKNSSEASSKRPRNETPSPLPAFKVRKEKMGDRITALQQLVSPFGKTDTASVLSEAIQYIKFLHEQVSVLSNPYLKNGAPIQHQQNPEKSKVDPDGPRQDLRSRGLCLVPVSSTFPVTHETAVDFWTPTFGGTFR